MDETRRKLIELIEQGRVSQSKVDDALALLKIRPDGLAWSKFVDFVLLCLGGLSLAFSLLFFIAYNWAEIGRFTKFGLVEVSIVVSVLVFVMQKKDAVVGKVALLVACVLLGVLMALFGQTYQTGADPWQLFFNWALLMLPWAVIGRFSAIWSLWITLLNLSIVLYFESMRSALWSVFDSTNLWWVLLIFNTALLVVWECVFGRFAWLKDRWPVRLLAVASGVSVTWLVLNAIFSNDEPELIGSVVWVAWILGLYGAYRVFRPDLFMLAGGCLSGVVVTISFMTKHVFNFNSSESFLLLSLITIGLGAGSAVWLRRVHQEWQS